MQKIAIIGMACLFPGAQTPDAFWRVLQNGQRTTSDATPAELGVDPAHFFGLDRTNPDTSYFLHGGYIRDFKPDDLPTVLTDLDRAYKWSYSVAQAALADSGYLDTTILERTGVILGSLSFPTRLSTVLYRSVYDAIMSHALDDLFQRNDLQIAPVEAAYHPRYQDYQRLSIDNMLSPGHPAAVVASLLKLGGTHFALDAACASSLYAVGLACKYLASGAADMMLAGAVSAADPVFVNMGFAHLGGYPTPDKQSLPLDADSDGLVAGEGAGMFILKRHADAVRDGDHIYALVNGIGLANDGRGKHVLTPNSKGQILALSLAGVADLDYVECHASGTSLGDKTELRSMAAFYGDDHPSIGSVKSNVGHLLTAAGMASMIKVILSLAHQQLPPTINIQTPLTSLPETHSNALIITQTQAWQPDGRPRRAGVNAFGFGGVSAHLVLEANEQQDMRTTQPSHRQVAQQPQLRLAITGMDAHFGPLNSLDDFARGLYEGEAAFIDLPEDRWKGLDRHPDVLQQLGLEGDVPKGAYIDRFDIDFMKYRIPPNPEDEPIPQQLLLLKVADNAVRDAGLNEGQNVAVIVALGIELALHRYRGRADLNWQIEQTLNNAGITLDSEQTEELKRIAKSGILSHAQVNHYASYIGNITASRVSSLWDFSGPAMTVSSEEHSVFKALEVAQLLLADGDVEAVVVGAVDLAGSFENVLGRNNLAPLHKGKPVAGFDAQSNGWVVGEGAGAVVLQRAEQTDQRQVYALIKSMVSVQASSSQDGLPITPSAENIAQAAQQALTQAGVSTQDIGYVELHSSGIEAEDQAEIMGLSRVYRGASPETAVGTVKATIGHTFAASGMASLIKTALSVAHRYIPAVANWNSPERPDQWNGTAFWVANKSRTWFADERHAAINGIGLDGVASHIVLGSAPQSERHSLYLQTSSPYLLPIAGSTVHDISTGLARLERDLQSDTDLQTIANQTFAHYSVDTAYTLCLIGRDKAELLKQAEQAQSGINTDGTWSTPAGSYFTARPIGKTGDVAFVYPGAFNSYPKMGYDLFQLFPKIYTALQQVKADVGDAISEHLLYPRTLEKPGPRLTRQMKDRLGQDLSATVENGLSFALLYSQVMQDTFKVQPGVGFGYSLGEGSMMWGMGVWRDGDAGSQALRQSPLFTQRLAGPMNSVREAWGIRSDVDTHLMWTAHFIAAPVETVQAAVQHENKVYLTHINTPNEVMIAGDPAACQRVIDAISAESMKAPFSAAIHNEAMLSEYQEMRRLHDITVHPVDGIRFYSAADYEPIRLDQTTIATSIARMTCKQIDFPRLIEKAYNDGARVFIELGPRSTCARWINESLGKRDHLAVSIDNLSADDRTSIVRMLAQLVSHRVPLDLSPLFAGVDDAQGKSLVRSVRLGGNNIYATVVNEATRTQFGHGTVAPVINMQTQTALPEGIHQVHTDFLESRRESLRQMSEMIQMQMAQSTAPVTAPSITPSAPPHPSLPPVPPPTPSQAPSVIQSIQPEYNQYLVETFAKGRVADCFGDRYTIYDNRRAPRIPNGDLLLVNRVIRIEGERFVTQPGTSIHTEYDVPAAEWFYRDNPYPVMPYSVYMEVALQPCGFLSAHHGPTLDYPDIDFYFRNLDGYGKLYRDVDMRGRTITNHVTLLRSTTLQGTIIQSFDFHLYNGDELFYEGEATFGYFTLEALSSQAGLDAGQQVPRWLDTVAVEESQITRINPRSEYGEGYLKLAHGMLEFTDEIIVIEHGGTYGAGYAYANTIIRPQAWFFSAHFYQDPVMPGSIGVETILQAMQAYAIQTGLGDEFSYPRFAQSDDEHTTTWKYRGQILSNSEKSHVEANIKRIERTPDRITIYADASLWRDTLRIYEVTDIALSIIEA